MVKTIMALVRPKNVFPLPRSWEVEMKYVMLGSGSGQMLLQTNRDLKLNDMITIYEQNVVWSPYGAQHIAHGLTYRLSSSMGTTHTRNYGTVPWFGITIVNS